MNDVKEPMMTKKSLPTADYEARVETMLNKLSASWCRTQVISSCSIDGPCRAHPDRGECCKNSQGVAYQVYSGPLRGHWKAWGSAAGMLVFEKMLVKLDASWRASMRDFQLVARAMRSVGK